MRKIKTNKIDAVFEGGGVKGSAFVGAIEITEKKGYAYENLAGTSAGSLVAALLAAGYDSRDIKQFIDTVDYKKFKDETTLDSIPLLGPGLELFHKEGIYKGHYVMQWIEELLLRKNVKTFGDLIIPEYAKDPRYKYKLQVIASDITNGKLLVLPGDAKQYGINPDHMPVALALRMSISIPFFYQPVVVKHRGTKTYIVDGGILSNYPVWLLDDGTTNPPWPTFGYKLVDPTEGKPAKIDGPVNFFKAMFSTMVEAHDARYISDADFMRTIPIKTHGIQTTDFNITQAQKDLLYNSGKEAAKKFFKSWDFEQYKLKARKTKPERTKRVWN